MKIKGVDDRLFEGRARQRESESDGGRMRVERASIAVA